MPRFGLNRNKFQLPSRYYLLLLTILCVVLMLLSFFTDILTIPLSAAASYTIIPFQRGLDSAGRALNDRIEDLQQVHKVMALNEQLQEELDELRLLNSSLVQDRYELQKLRELMDIEKEVVDYERTGARVIGKDPGNWFSVFIIDKGKSDGLAVDMNVVAGNGLVGIITEVGFNWATVRSVIDDSSNVSGMVLSTSDTLMVSGDLKLMNEGAIRFSQLDDEDDQVSPGDEVVTSNISDKFLPGITIGYIGSIEKDPNNLTSSGTINPSVDFDHLDNVLVIRELKKGRRDVN